MEPNVLKALKKSIKLWQKRARGVYNVDPCPLCQEFKSKVTAVIICTECPVAILTGAPTCHNTPFYDYHQVKKKEGITPKTMLLAHKMTGVLVRCLP